MLYLLVYFSLTFSLYLIDLCLAFYFYLVFYLLLTLLLYMMVNLCLTFFIDLWIIFLFYLRITLLLHFQLHFLLNLLFVLNPRRLPIVSFNCSRFNRRDRPWSLYIWFPPHRTITFLITSQIIPLLHILHKVLNPLSEQLNMRKISQRQLRE